MPNSQTYVGIFVIPHFQAPEFNYIRIQTGWFPVRNRIFRCGKETVKIGFPDNFQPCVEKGFPVFTTFVRYFTFLRERQSSEKRHWCVITEKGNTRPFLLHRKEEQGLKKEIWKISPGGGDISSPGVGNAVQITCRRSLNERGLSLSLTESNQSQDANHQLRQNHCPALYIVRVFMEALSKNEKGRIQGVRIRAIKKADV